MKESLYDTIEWLNCKLEATMPDRHPPRCSRALELQMEYLIEKGQFIGAIKLCREITKWSLKDAKEYADRIRSNINRQDPF